MKNISKYILPVFYVIVLGFIIFMGSKLITGNGNIKLDKEEINLSLDANYQIGIDADSRADRDNSKYKYESKDESIATVDDNGLVTPVGSGNTEIIVKRGLKKATLKVNVTDIPMDSIEVTNDNIVINVGESYNVSNLIKKGSYSYTYSYISSSDNILTVDNKGIAKGIAPGRVVVTITTNNGVNTDISFTVLSKDIEATSIEIDNKVLKIKVGATTKLNAYVYPDNVTNKNVTWISSNPSVVTVDSLGNIRAIAKGNATITATTVNGLRAQSIVSVIANTTPVKPQPQDDGTVVKSITVNPTSLVVSVGGSANVKYTILPTTATNKNVTWHVDNKDIINVYSDGRIEGKKVGTAHATVKTYNNKTATVTVNVVSNTINPTKVSLNITNKTIYVGDSFSLIATVTPANATDKTITWSTSDSSIARVNNGRVTGVGAGTATITAKTKNGKTATAKVIVNKKIIQPTSITLNSSSISIGEGKSTTLVATVVPSNATDKTVKWKSNDTSVATVTSGKVTGKKAGTTYVTATTSNGIVATAKVTVTKTSVPVTGISLNKTKLSLVEGNSETLTATITPSNATDKNIIWTSSNTNIATVSGGKVVAKKAGTVTITAKTSNNKTATCTVTVTKKTIVPTSIKLNATSGSLRSTYSRTLTATVLPSNADNKTVTWSSSDTKVATVNSKGKITAKKAGTAIITAKTVNGKTAKYTITVKNVRIAMIGNSKTHTSPGSVYNTFVKVMANGGYSASIKRSTVGGTSLVEHARGHVVNTGSSTNKIDKLPGAKKVITDNTFDIAILQEQTDATYTNSYYKVGAKEVRDLLLKNNKNTKIYLRTSWYYQDSIKSKQSAANKNAENIAKAYNMTVIYDGNAFLKYINQYGNYNIYRDDTHGTYEGVYLAATCIYKKVTGADPTKLTYYGEGGVTKARAKIFQAIAKSVC